MQNIRASVRTVVYSDPEIALDAGVNAGAIKPFEIPDTVAVTFRLPVGDDKKPRRLNDSKDAVAPLYDGSGGGNAKDALVYPYGAKPAADSPADAVTYDTPFQFADLMMVAPLIDPATKKKIGEVTYRKFVKATIDDEFRTWGVTFDVATKEAVTLAETGWKLDVDSSRANEQRAKPLGEQALSLCPVTGKPFFNELLNDAKQYTTEPVGKGTIRVPTN